MNDQSPKTKKLKIIRIGNSAGIVLPREMLAKLRVELGDDLFVTGHRTAWRRVPTAPLSSRR